MDSGTSYYYPENTEEPWTFLYFNFWGATQLVQELIDKFGHVYDLSAGSALVKRLRRFRRYGHAVIPMSHEAGSALVFGILGELVDELLSYHATGSHVLLRRAEDLIESNLENGIDVNTLARLLSVSRQYLHRIFRENAGMSPADYITQRKMKRARALLATTDLECSEIASRLGYSTSSNFARVFSRTTGDSPSRFRRKAP